MTCKILHIITRYHYCLLLPLINYLFDKADGVTVALLVLGYLNPVTGALVHNIGSVLVVLNAAMLYDRNFDI